VSERRDKSEISLPRQRGKVNGVSLTSLGLDRKRIGGGVRYDGREVTVDSLRRRQIAVVWLVAS
jgi:hypothetical protein